MEYPCGMGSEKLGIFSAPMRRLRLIGLTCALLQGAFFIHFKKQESYDEQ